MGGVRAVAEDRVRTIVTTIHHTSGKLRNKLSLLIAHAVNKDVVNNGKIVSKTLTITGIESLDETVFFNNI